MKKICLLLLLVNITCFAQQKGDMDFLPLSNSDSMAVSNTFSKYITALRDSDKKTLRKLSLGKIECAFCKDEGSYKNYHNYVAPESILQIFNNDYKSSSFDKIIAERGYRIRPMKIWGYQPETVPQAPEEGTVFYEVWIHTLLPDELEKGHEGASFAFQFVKVKNDFKLYGVTSIP